MTDRWHGTPADGVHRIGVGADRTTRPAYWCSEHSTYHTVSEADALRLAADPGIVEPELETHGNHVSERGDRWGNRAGFALAIFAAVYLMAHVLARQFCGQ